MWTRSKNKGCRRPTLPTDGASLGMIGVSVQAVMGLRISARRTGTITRGPGRAARKLADEPGRTRSVHQSTSPLHHRGRNAPQWCASQGGEIGLGMQVLQSCAILSNTFFSLVKRLGQRFESARRLSLFSIYKPDVHGGR